MNEMVRRLAVAAGLAAPGQANPYGGHSLRAGFVTEALRDAKLTVAEVQQVSGHRSAEALLSYSREVNAPKHNPSRRLLGRLANPDGCADGAASDRQ